MRTFTRCSVSAVVVLVTVACSTPPGDEAEVAGLVLEREEGGAEADEEVPPPPVEAPAVRDGGLPEGDEDLGIVPLIVLQSGPAAVGTSWVATAGTWVGLDGQTLERGVEPPPLHLDAAVEVRAADPARPTGCVVRLAAPAGAELQVVGTLTADLVVDEPGDVPSRAPVDGVALDLLLAPGDAWELGLLLGADTDLTVPPRPDASIRCEGRFDRS